MNDRSYIKPILGIGGLLLTALVVAGLFRSKSSKIQIDPNQILSVCEIAPDPDRFQGHLRVKGTVNSVFPDQATFALADIPESRVAGRKTKANKRNCGGKKRGGGCGTPLIPVKFDGPLPELHADVLIEGSIITHDSGKKFFQAEKITEL